MPISNETPPPADPGAVDPVVALLRQARSVIDPMRGDDRRRYERALDLINDAIECIERPPSP